MIVHIPNAFSCGQNCGHWIRSTMESYRDIISFCICFLFTDGRGRYMQRNKLPQSGSLSRHLQTFIVPHYGIALKCIISLRGCQMYDDACPHWDIQTANVARIFFSSKTQCVVTNNDFSKSQINWCAVNLAYLKYSRISFTWVHLK